jgi:hypothetical protein
MTYRPTKAYSQLHGRKHHDKIRKAALAILGALCAYCGIDDPMILMIDHRMDDGAAERKNGKNLAQQLVKGLVSPANYQVLCHNCNWRKEYLRRRG